MRCSEIWRESTHLAAGTAPVAQFWVGVEQPGSWGRQALTQSDLDPALGARLEQASEAAGGKAVLIRRPSERASQRAGTRSIIVSGGQLDNPWLIQREVPLEHLPIELNGLINLIEQGEIGPQIEGYLPAPAALLICTNGKRDVCCAISARPLEDELLKQGAGELPAGVRIWESSHLNGHRFAPTGLVLPTGQMFAWLDLSSAREALAAASQGRLANLGARRERGRTALPRAVQVVDIAVRELSGLTDPTSLHFTPEEGAGLDQDAATFAQDQASPASLVISSTGATVRSWQAEVSAVAAPDLPESCGKQAVPVADWQVQIVEVR